MELNKWVVGETDMPIFDTFAEADERARIEESYVVEYEFEFVDSSIVADYRPDNERSKP